MNGIDLDQTQFRVPMLEYVLLHLSVLAVFPEVAVARDMNGPSSTVTEQKPADDFSIYDHPLMQRDYLEGGFVSEPEDSPVAKDGQVETTEHRAVLQLENIRCPGCCSSIEKIVNDIDGVLSAEMNYTTHQMRLAWDSTTLGMSDLLRALHKLGYPGQPVNVQARNRSLAEDRKTLIRRTGVAAALGMQIMVLSVCLYTGEWWGIDPALFEFFRMLSLLLVVPLLVYSARSFFTDALQDLKRLRVGMDVPVALGLTVAFIASIHSLIQEQGDTYFDSIAMFVFLLLGARLIELNHRLCALSSLGQFDSVLPVSAHRLGVDNTVQQVPTLSLQSGDRVLVSAGEVVPADGVINTGESSFDESLLTGESLPVVVSQGEDVIAGSVNVENPVTVSITGVGEDTVFSAMARLARQAQFEKPAVSRLVEQLARWFVVVVLTIATLVAVFGYLSGSDNWLPSTIAVLIVSCPCALALATPAALSMAMGRALNEGLMVVNAQALETLARADHYFFDKTGTLTTGVFAVREVICAGSLNRQRAIAIACALEHYSNHPIAESIRRLTNESVNPVLTVDNVVARPGGGLSGRINGKQYYIGNQQYLMEQTGHSIPDAGASTDTIAALADNQGVQAVFYLQDQIRPGAAELIRHLTNRNIRVSILSGDRENTVAAVASELGVEDYHAACTPEDKVLCVSAAVEQGDVTAMLGDGLNDAAVVGAVHVSIAMGDRVNLTSMSADIVALSPSMPTIESLLLLSAQLTRTIRQNLAWALSYNAIAIPFAAVGWVPPWLAAVGMSLSSLLVVMNASRLGRNRGPDKDRSKVRSVDHSRDSSWTDTHGHKPDAINRQAS